MGAPEQQQGSSAPTHHNNGVVVTPLLHDDEQLPPSSIPAGYPQSNQQGWTTQPAAPQSQEEPRKFFNETSYAGLRQGQPAPVVQGMQAGPMSTDQPLFCPATQDGPTFLGATVGHHQIPIQCGACGYQGPSHVIQTRGFAHGMWGIMTLGLGFLCKVGMDTHHFCPGCKKHVADAKLM